MLKVGETIRVIDASYALTVYGHLLTEAVPRDLKAETHVILTIGDRVPTREYSFGPEEKNDVILKGSESKRITFIHHERLRVATPPKDTKVLVGNPRRPRYSTGVVNAAGHLECYNNGADSFTTDGATSFWREFTVDLSLRK